MSVLRSLRRGVGAVVGNPSMFVPALLFALLGLPPIALLFTGRTLLSNGYQIVTLLVAPLFLAGTVGMAYEALRTGHTSLGEFGRVGRHKYVTVLLAEIGQVAVMATVVVAGMIATFVATAVVGVGVLGVASGTGGDGFGSALGVGMLVLMVGVYLLFLLVVLLVGMFLQFYGVAAVVEDTGAVGSLRRSVGFVRKNLLPTLGYSVLLFLVGLLNWVPTVGLLFAGGGVDPATSPAPGSGAAANPFDVDATTALAFGAYAVLWTTVVYPFQRAFATAFFVDHRRSDAGVDGAASSAPASGGSASLDD
ncbi:hypothetical protein ACFO0N_12900 [Halobium salinum]|uniref:DUF7847 domain-containing protein n=1 Tax=Halobium salinum TaxID=1364940 RepID=A0ABD5PDV8_9EURY|nr:hypothetical protein [Halobium salinum]